MIVALLGLFVGLSGVGIAANGQSLILGKSDNSATLKTVLSTQVNDKALQLTNTNAGTNATALGLTVASGHAPFTVSSQTRVANLNADKLDGFDTAHFLATTGKAADSDKLDGIDSSGFLRSQGEIELWYSPWDYLPFGPATTVFPASGPTASVHRTSAGYTAVVMPLDQLQHIFGTGLKLRQVTICFRALGAVIVSTSLVYGDVGQDTVAYSDTFTHSSPEKTCYGVAPSTPTVISGSLFLYLGLYSGDPPASIALYSVRVTLTT